MRVPDCVCVPVSVSAWVCVFVCGSLIKANRAECSNQCGLPANQFVLTLSCFHFQFNWLKTNRGCVPVYVCIYVYMCVSVLQWKPQKWQTTTITMASRNCKINGVKLAKRERVVANRGNHKADRRGSTSSPLEDAAQSAETRCFPFDGPRRCDSWVSPKDGTNESIDALPATACTTMDNNEQHKEQRQQQVKCPGRIQQSRRNLPSRTENLSTFHARVICASRAADAAIA